MSPDPRFDWIDEPWVDLALMACVLSLIFFGGR